MQLDDGYVISHRYLMHNELFNKQVSFLLNSW